MSIMKSIIFALFAILSFAMAHNLEGTSIQFPGGLVAKDHTCSGLEELNAAFHLFQEDYNDDHDDSDYRNLRGDSSSSELVTLGLTQDENHRNLYNCGRYCSCCGASWCCMICGWGCRRRAEEVESMMKEEEAVFEMPGCLAGATTI